MRNSLFLLFIFFTQLTFSQEVEEQKISFITGIGGSYPFSSLYQNPVVDLSTKNVIIEKAQNFKSNISLGIAYTGKTLILQDNTRVPYGWTGIAFINPISLSSTSNNQSFFENIDFGFGLGWKFAGGFLIAGTLECFNVRQPKDWFIDKYRNNDTQFLVDGSPQVAFDVNDNNIFKNKMVITAGLKFCYTFDIIKSFKDNTNETYETNQQNIVNPSGGVTGGAAGGAGDAGAAGDAGDDDTDK